MCCSCNNADNSVENCFNKLGTLQNFLLWSKIAFKIKPLALCLHFPAKTLCFSFLDYIILCWSFYTFQSGKESCREVWVRNLADCVVTKLGDVSKFVLAHISKKTATSRRKKCPFLLFLGEFWWNSLWMLLLFIFSCFKVSVKWILHQLSFFF